MPRSLYQCFNTKVLGDRIRCAKGHALSKTRGDGTIGVVQLARGEPLELTVCQMCPDYDEMGPPIPAHQRGWEKPDKTMLVSELNLSTRAANCLRRNNLITVAQVLEKSPQELLDMRWFGEGCLTDLIDALADEGIEYAGGSVGD